MNINNKKAFTLVELLGVLVLLGVIGLITIPTVSTLIKNSKEKALLAQEKIIVDAAKSWAADNSSQLPSTGSVIITIQDLINSNYIDDETLDKINDVKYTTKCVSITSSTKYNTYDYAVVSC